MSGFVDTYTDEEKLKLINAVPINEGTKKE